MTLAAAGRVLIVGDVHGCYDELDELLQKYRKPGDTVILAGDIVNKGPKSVEALRLARSLDQCHSLIGNHELVSLRGRFEREGGKSPDCAPRYAWTDELSESDVEWICRLPFTIALPAHDVIVVHAGLVPGIPLEHQAPEDMTTMRDLVRGDDMSYRASYKSELGAVAWADEWPSRPHVYFGHDAKRGLQLAKYATGLDTGCVYGGALSAAILERGRTVQIVQVQAKRQYAPKRGAVMISKARGSSFMALSSVLGSPLVRQSVSVIISAALFAAAVRWLRT